MFDSRQKCDFRGDHNLGTRCQVKRLMSSISTGTQANHHKVLSVPHSHCINARYRQQLTDNLKCSTAHPGIKVLTEKSETSLPGQAPPPRRRPSFATQFVAVGSYSARLCAEGSSVRRACAAPLEWLFRRSCRPYHMITVLLARIGAARMTK